jgi:hypothetical protein
MFTAIPMELSFISAALPLHPVVSQLVYPPRSGLGFGVLPGKSPSAKVVANIWDGAIDDLTGIFSMDCLSIAWNLQAIFKRSYR